MIHPVHLRTWLFLGAHAGIVLAILFLGWGVISPS